MKTSILSLSFLFLFLSTTSLQSQTLDCPADVTILAGIDECCQEIPINGVTMVSGVAVPDITLYHPSTRMWHCGVAYNPDEQLYYQVPLAGGSNNDISTHDINGNLVHAVNVGFNYRGLWWNSGTDQLQGNIFDISDVHIVTVDLDANQYALSTGPVVVGDEHPYFHMSFDYDFDNDEILGVWQEQLYRYTTSGLLISSMPLAQAPGGGAYNRYQIGYSGIPGAEIMRYDYINKRVVYFDKENAAYAGEIAMPANLPSNDQSLYNLSFANDRVWLYNNQTDTWYAFLLDVNEQTVVQTAGLPLGSCYPLGITSNTFIVTDVETGNTATCSFDVNILEDPNSTANCNADEDWIENVVIGNFQNQSGNNQGYESFNLTVNLTSDGNHLVTLTPGYGDMDEHVFWRIYVDYNQNGIFEHAGERVLQMNGVGPQTKSFNVPPTVMLGQTSLRITMGVGGYLLPGATGYQGEMEDYLVEINECIDLLDGGNLDTNGSVYCPGSNNPGPIFDNSGISFGNVEYVWVKNETSCEMPNVIGDLNWEIVPGATASQYTPGPITTSTAYARGVRNVGCQDYAFTNPIEYTLTSDCLPNCASAGASTADAYIFRFKLGGINNISGDDGGYADYSSLQGNVNPGQNTSFQLRPRFYKGSQVVHWRVWIDLNQDGVFSDLCEKVIERSAANTQNGTIVIPEGTLAGQAKVRVSMKIGGYPDACESFAEGEVEDYMITINPSNFQGDLPEAIEVRSMILEDQKELSLTVSPNPTQSLINIQFDGVSEQSELSFINQFGQTIMRQGNLEQSETLTVDLNSMQLSSGLYFIQLRSGNQIRTERITFIE